MLSARKLTQPVDANGAVGKDGAIEGVVAKAAALGQVHHRLPPAGMGGHSGFRPIYGSGHRAAGAVSQLHPLPRWDEGAFCDLLHHQQLCTPEADARAGEAEVLSGAHLREDIIKGL